MTPTNKSIETLKTQVDKVSTDIESLKTETSEELKKAKAEIIEKNAGIVKVEITQKLETLKWLTDEKSKTDAAKLEEMLKTLETTKVLKWEVTQSREVVKNKETVDNTTDLQSIVTGFEVIKNLVKELQTNIDTYKSQKDKMNATDKATKEKEIEEKKIVIEVKRKEIQTIIDKIKKWRKEIKIDDIDDENIKKILKDQKIKEEALLTNYETELTSVKNPASTFMETLKDGANKTWERTKEHKKPILIATGIWAGIFLLSRLFRRKKKEKSEKDGEKKEKKPRYKKWWGILGIWAGWILAWKNRDKIKDFFSGLFGKENKETKPKTDGSYEWLPEDMKEKYRSVSSGVDEYATNIWGTITTAVFDEDTSKDKEKKSAVIFGLDKEVKTLKDATNNDTLNYMQSHSSDGFMNMIGNRSKEKIYNVIGSYLTGLASFASFLPKFATDPIVALNEWLIAGTPEVHERELAQLYTEYINTLNYVTEKKRIFKEQLAKEQVMGKENIQAVPSKEQLEQIEDLLDGDSTFDGKVDTFFAAHSIADIPALLSEYKVEEGQLSTETQELLQDLEEEKNNILQIDDNKETAITRAETDFLDGSLDDNSKKELTKVCEDMLAIEFGDDGRSLFGAYTHLISDIFAGNTELEKNFLEKTQLKEMIEDIKKTFNEYISKIKAGTFNQQDLQQLKNQTDTYFKVKKQYEVSIANISEASKGLHFDRYKALCLPYNAVMDVAKVFDGKNSWRARVGYGMWWLYVWGQTLYIGSYLIPKETLLGKWAKIVTKMTGKAAIKIGKLPITLTEKWLKLATGRTHITSLGWTRYLRDADHLDELQKRWLLKYAFLNGEVSESGVIRAARRLNIWALNGNSSPSIEGLLDKWWLHTEEQRKLFIKYKKNPSLRKLLITETKTQDVSILKKGKNILTGDSKLNIEVNFNTINIDRLQNLEKEIAKFGLESNKAKFWEAVLQNTKTLDNIEEILKLQTGEYTLEVIKQMKTIKWAKIAVLQDVSKAKSFDKLYVLGDDADDISRKILHERNIAEGKNYFTDGKKIGEAKAYAQEIIQRKGIWSVEEMGKILGRQIHNFTTPQEAKNYFKFIQNNEKNITNYKNFVSNTANKREKIKSLPPAEQARYAQEVKLNTSYLSRRIDWMKDNFKKSAETLRKLIKEKRTPYIAQVEASAQWLEDMGKVENEVYEAAQAAEQMGQGEWMMSMSKNKSLINELAPLFKDEAFVKAISKAKTSEAVRDVFKTFGKEMPKNVPEEFIGKLAKSGGTKQVNDVMNYVVKYESLGKVMKIIQHPAMKYAGRVLQKTLLIATPIIAGFSFYQTSKEAEEIKKNNLERWTVKQDEARADLAITTAWAVAFVPGIWWIAAGAILAGTGIAMYAKEVIFDTTDKYTKNYKDFLHSTPLLIKQHILSTILGEAKEDATTGEYLARRFSGKNFSHLTKKTGSEAIKALLYIEEWNTNQLAMYDIRDPDQMASLARLNPPKNSSDVAKAVDEVEKRVNIRYDYLKSKLGVYTNGKVTERNRMFIPGMTIMPVNVEYTDKTQYIDLKKALTPELIKQGKGMKELNDILMESSYTVNNPENFGTVQQVEQQKQILRKELAAVPQDLKKLDAIFFQDKKALLYIYRYLNEYKQHLDAFGEQESKKDDIIKHMQYLNTYMTYRGLNEWLDIEKLSQGFAPVNLITCRNFLVDFTAPKITSAELYGNTPNIQNVLYRIATEVIGVNISNTKEDILFTFSEEHEKNYGLYFDDNDFKQLNVNGNYTTDNEYDATNAQQLSAIRTDIAEQIKDGDLIKVGTGTTIFNKEIGSKYLKIIDEELIRK